MDDKELETGGVKVKVKATASTEGTASAKFKATAAAIEVTDSLGRTIKVKKPSPLGNLDFAKAAGSDKINVLYLSEVSHLKYVCEIDGVQVLTPRTDGELRALYQRLGEDGNAAAMAAVIEHFYNAQSNEEEELKNS